MGQMLNTEERSWANAPPGAKTARLLIILTILYYALWVLVGASTWTVPSREGVYLVAFFGSLIVFQLWMLRGLRQGHKACYYIQWILSTIGLLAFPVGTIISAIVLMKWKRPETRAWFGV
jgi:hypothetical protein